MRKQHSWLFYLIRFYFCPKLRIVFPKCILLITENLIFIMTSSWNEGIDALKIIISHHFKSWLDGRAVSNFLRV